MTRIIFGVAIFLWSIVFLVISGHYYGGNYWPKSFTEMILGACIGLFGFIGMALIVDGWIKLKK